MLITNQLELIIAVAHLDDPTQHHVKRVFSTKLFANAQNYDAFFHPQCAVDADFFKRESTVSVELVDAPIGEEHCFFCAPVLEVPVRPSAL